MNQVPLFEAFLTLTKDLETIANAAFAVLAKMENPRSDFQDDLYFVKKLPPAKFAEKLWDFSELDIDELLALATAEDTTKFEEILDEFMIEHEFVSLPGGKIELQSVYESMQAMETKIGQLEKKIADIKAHMNKVDKTSLSSAKKLEYSQRSIQHLSRLESQMEKLKKQMVKQAEEAKDKAIQENTENWATPETVKVGEIYVFFKSGNKVEVISEPYQMQIGGSKQWVVDCKRIDKDKTLMCNVDQLAPLSILEED